MVDLTLILTSLIFFGITLLYYTNLNSSITRCLSFLHMYLFLGLALSKSTSVSLFCNFLVDFFERNFVETLVILSVILLPIKSPVASALF